MVAFLHRLNKFMATINLPQLSQLQALRGNPVIFYSASIGDNIDVLYECLHKQGKNERLDLVLSTGGGSVITARQIALLLREYTQHLTILVPFRARSAGTLLCLSANQLVLGPLAELGPIDTQVSSIGPPPPDAPGMISAEDIRTFREMAESWFGVDREEDRLQVLALLAQRIFPTSLSSFYRFDKLIHEVANELLTYQIPGAEESVRQRIVEQLVGGYYSHDYVLSRTQARELGLQVRFTSAEEETLLWKLIKTYRKQTTQQPGEEGTNALIASTNFQARQVHRWVNLPSSDHNDSQSGGTSRPSRMLDTTWETD